MESKNTNMTSEVEVVACDSPARLCNSCKTHKPRAKGNPSICQAVLQYYLSLLINDKSNINAIQEHIQKHTTG
jgi:hypothetical protein